MCRLFGFRSVIKSQMHRSLVSADNALVRQSEQHPDGWGVAGLMDAWTEIQYAVESNRDERMERVRRFRDEERRGDRAANRQDRV